MKDTKDKIMLAAKRLFSAKGYEAVTTRDIAKEAEVTLSSLAYHFTTKDNLLGEMLEEFGAESREAALATLSPVKSVDEFKVRLEIFLETLISGMIKDIPLFKVFVTEGDKGNPAFERLQKDPAKDLVKSLIRFFERAQQDGLLAKDIDAYQTASSLFLNVIFTIKSDGHPSKLVRGSLGNPAFRKKWIANSVRVYFGGILNPPKELTATNRGTGKKR